MPLKWSIDWKASLHSIAFRSQTNFLFLQRLIIYLYTGRWKREGCLFCLLVFPTVEKTPWEADDQHSQCYGMVFQFWLERPFDVTISLSRSRPQLQNGVTEVGHQKNWTEMGSEQPWDSPQIKEKKRKFVIYVWIWLVVNYLSTKHEN